MYDTGSTTFMLICTMLVFLMTPGLAFFYGGLSRRKNVINTMLMCFGAIGLVGVLWIVAGWSLAYGGDGSSPFIGGFDQLLCLPVLNQVLQAAEGNAAGGAVYPQIINIAFQMAFAMITAAIVTGSLAGRVKFGAMTAFLGIWLLVVYAPLAHMVWGGDGSFIGDIIGALDFAGGDVVHISSGLTGLILCLMLGRRRGFGMVSYRPHNVPFVALGAGLLWFGWFGFNGGSEFKADAVAALAILNTVTASAAGMVSWLAVELVSQMTMVSNILGPVVGTAVYGYFGIDALCTTASVAFAISALLFGGALKQNASFETMGDGATRTTCRNDFRESIRYLLQNALLVAVILLAAVLNLALVGLMIGAPIIVTKHLGMQSSCVGIVEVAMGLGGLAGSGLVGIWPHRFSFKGICRYVAMICFGVVPIIVTLLSGPDELALAALAAGSAWVMAWASIASVEIVSFVQRSAPKELCGKVLALVYMMLSCATPIGQLVYGLAYDRWTPAIVFAGMLAVLTLTTALFYRLKNRLWRLP